MELAEKIDPAEVLAHLKQMGYSNITPAQLKEFVNDLKKLIIYDHISSSSDSLTSLSSSYTTDSEYYSTSETSNSSGDLKGSPELKGRHHQGVWKKSRDQKGRLASNNSSDTSGSNGHLLRRASSSSSSLPGKQQTIQKENLPHRHEGRARTKSINSEDLQEAVKPKTSFIRPWQLQGSGSALGRMGKSDPVSLYHYYQTLWSQRKCPGEDSHADLRWVIRERMLGQDPHLYAHPQNVLNNPTKRHNRMRL